MVILGNIGSPKGHAAMDDEAHAKCNERQHDAHPEDILGVFAKEDDRANAREDAGDASNELDAERAARPGFVFFRIEVLDVGMFAHEVSVREPCRDDERKACYHT